jgi:Undecaprenyl-phosphate galactose phosphotransferase WbaP
MGPSTIPQENHEISGSEEQVARIDILRGRSILVILILLIGDILSIGFAFWLATEIRAALIPLIGGVIRWDIFLPLLELNLISILITYTLTGLYPGFGRTAVEEMQQIFYSLTLGYGVLGIAIYFQKTGPEFPRFVFLAGWALACLFNLIVRFTIRNRASLLKWWGTPVVVVGPITETCDVVEKLLRSRRLGLKPVLIVDKTAPSNQPNILGLPVIQSPSHLQEVISRNPIQYAVYVEAPGDSHFETRAELSWLSKFFPTVLVVLANSPLGSLWVRTMDLEGRLTLRAQYHLLDKKSTYLKRAFDVVLGILLAVLALPLFIVIMVLIKLDSPGPAFHSNERLGLGGKRIRYLKFRTMSFDAEQRLEELLGRDPLVRQEYHKHHKLANDPRVTRMGKILRKFSLDELPQLWHVLQGEMSLVGPRAYLPSELKDMGTYADLIFQIRPGLTGWWQVMGRHATTFQHRLQLDEYYLSNWSLWLDIYILLKTGWVLLSGSGV